MANPINYQDIIDLDGLRAQLKATEADTKQFVENSTKLFNVLKASSEEIAKSFEKTREAMSSKTGSGLNDTAAKLQQETAQYTNQRAAMDGLKATEQQLSAVQQSLTQRTEELMKRYAELNGTSAKVVQEKKRIATELVNLQSQFDKLDKVVKTSSGVTKEVTGTYNKLQKELADARQALRSLDDAFDKNTGKLNKNNAEAVRLAATIRQNDNLLRNFDTTLAVHNRNIGNYPKSIEGAITSLTQLAASYISFDAAVRGAKWFYEESVALEGYDKALREVTRNESDYAQSKLFLIGLADRLGVEYTTLIDKYKMLRDATKDTVLEGEEANKIFANITTAGAKLSFSNEVISGTLLAVIQMISKGKVQMEELRQQLGERLPSAIRLMSLALGVSEPKLNKMAEQGELLATEVLPKFADKLGEAYSLKNGQQIEGIGASTARVKNETTLLVETFNQNKGITKFWGLIASGAQNALRNIRLFVQDGSWTELIQFVGPNSLSAKMEERRNKEDAVKAFSGMGEGDRYFKLQVLRDKEAEQQAKGLVDEARKTRDIRRKLQDMDLRATVQTMRDNRRKEGLEEISAVEKNEADLSRFLKQSARKRTGELLDLESKLAKAPNDAVLVAKLDAYKRLDIEQRGKEQAVAERMKSQKGQSESERVRELERQLREAIAKNRADTQTKASGLDAANASLSDSDYAGKVDYLSKRLVILQDGVLKEQEILIKAGKINSAEYEATQSQLNDIAKDYIGKRTDIEEKAIKELIDLTKTAMEADITLVKSGMSKRVAEIEKAYNKEKANIESLVASRKMSEGNGNQLLMSLRIELFKNLARATAAGYDTIEQIAQAKLKALEEKLRAAGKTEVEIAKAVADAKKLIASERKAGTESAADSDLKIDEEKNNKIVDGSKAATEEINGTEQELSRLRKDRAILDEEMAKAKAAGDEARVNRLTALITENDQKQAKSKKALFEQIADKVIAINAAFVDIANSQAEKEMQALNKKKEYELKMAGDNAAQKEAILKRYSREENAIRKKQAIAEKAQAIFSIGLSTAINAAKVGIGNPVLFALTIALGAAQIAAVAARPIPEYFKGKRDSYEGPAWVGERGYELIESKEGGKTSFRLAAEKQVTYLNRNDRVYTHEESKRMLSVNESYAEGMRKTSPSLGRTAQASNQQSGLTAGGIEQAMRNALADLPITEHLYDEKGHQVFIRDQNQRVEWANDYFSLPKSK